MTLTGGRNTPAKVLKTSARWYGVTYREDKPVITAAVSQMTADGEYPEDL